MTSFQAGKPFSSLVRPEITSFRAIFLLFMGFLSYRTSDSYFIKNLLQKKYSINTQVLLLNMSLFFLIIVIGVNSRKKYLKFSLLKLK